MIALGRLAAPEQKSVRAKLVRNVLFSGVRTLLVWPIPFLVIPFTLRKVGTDGYGIWAVCLTVINFTALADLGLGGTLTKQVAQHYANEDLEALERLINTALVLYSLVAVVLVAFLLCTSGTFLSLLFRDSGTNRLELQRLWRYVLAIVGLNVLSLPLYSVVTGLQRMDLGALTSVFNTVCGALLTVAFLCLPQEVLALSPLIRIIRNEENLGFSAANNKAIRFSHGQYVLILSDDAFLNPGSLQLMLEGIESDPRVAVVGPKFLDRDGSLQEHFTNACFPHLRHIVCQILMLERLWKEMRGCGRLSSCAEIRRKAARRSTWLALAF